jgi:hypothetical protein
MYKFIHSVNELQQFFTQVVPLLAEHEVFFVSLACRQKWMKNLGVPAGQKKSSEMFERKTIKTYSWNSFYRTIRKYEANEGAYTFDNGVDMPIEGMGVYWNINPSNMIRAVSEFSQKMVRSLAEVSLGQGSSMTYLNNLDRELMSCVHRAQGTKHYLDIDIDMVSGTKGTLTGDTAVLKILEELTLRGVKFFLIDTRSGYHILMKKETMTFNYQAWLKSILDNNRVIFDDLMVNGNRMVPLPGTLQGGHPVRIIYDLSNP